MLKFRCDQEVKDLCKQENKKYVIYKDVVYDVEEYMPTHPGGQNLLEDEVGTDIEEKFEEAEHTKSARRIFKDLPVVGKMARGDEATTDEGRSDDDAKVTSGGATHTDGGSLKSKFDFDYNKGLWWQVMNTEWTYEEYYDFINDPKALVNPIRNVRLFENQLMELITLTPWWLIPAFWTPISLLFLWKSQCSMAENALLFIVGLGVWSLKEYLIHRFVFHSEDFAYFPRFSKFYGLHFLMHGIHHAFP
jgi:4-hydroxysphinganine ceramide fatty acyl 2-hydroxylase